MNEPASSSQFCFQAAVERSLSVVFQHPDGSWEGHDYQVEVLTERQGLDAFDVVVDFRNLEATLDALLAPMRGRALADLGLGDPVGLAEKLLAELPIKIHPPARLISVSLTDGQGRRISMRASAP